MNRHALRTSALLAAALLSQACAPAIRSSSVNPASAMGVAAPLARIVDTRTNRDITFDALASQLARADVVFFGELHDDPVTHAAELALLAAIGERRDHVMLSLEMFERDVQQHLDNYLRGANAEKDFLAATRPWNNYTTDYRPMVELARVRGWPVVAANVPRPIASAVGRRGLAHLDTIDATQRSYAAANNECSRDAYYDKFVKTMGGGAGHGGPGGMNIDFVYQAQCVKDEAMAESIVRGIERAGKGTIVYHVNGSFHSDEHLGTVSRVKRRMPNARVVVLTSVPVANVESASATDHRDKADYVLLVRQVK